MQNNFCWVMFQNGEVRLGKWVIYGIQDRKHLRQEENDQKIEHK